MDLAQVNAFIIGCVILLASITGFLLKSWASNAIQTMGELVKNVRDLTLLISEVQHENKLIAVKMGYQQEEIDALREGACSKEDCLLRLGHLHARHSDYEEGTETHPGTIRVTGSGAKKISDLLQSAAEHSKNKGSV